jgi:hypothetical protein
VEHRYIWDLAASIARQHAAFNALVSDLVREKPELEEVARRLLAWLETENAKLMHNYLTRR